MRVLTGDQDPIIGLNEVQADPYRYLSPLQERFAEMATRAMVDILNVHEENVRLIVQEDEENSRSFVLTDGSSNGLYFGNYGKLLKMREEDSSVLFVDINGERIDTLSNTTYGVYWGMVCEAQHRGVIAPDSVALSHQSDLPWTATMLTGEPLTDEGLILVASVSSGAVSYVGFKPSRGGTSMRVRPSIAIPQANEL